MEQRNKVRGLAHDRNVAKVTIVAVPGPAGRRAVDLRAARRGRRQRRHDRPERRPRRRDRPLVHGPAGRARPRPRRSLEPVVRELGARELTTDASVGKVSIVGRRAAQRAGLRRPDVRDARRRRRQHRDDLDLRGPDHLHRSPRPSSRPRCARCTTPSSSSDPSRSTSPRRAAGASRAPMTAFLARRRAVRRASARPTTSSATGWPTATPEVCLAIADEQTAGRGREGRTWVAPPGAALLLSLGFRPTWLDPEPTLAAGRDRVARDGRGGGGGRRPAGRHDPPEVAERPRRRGRGDAASASWPASSARPTASARATRASSSGSASTPTGPAVDFPPDLADVDDLAARGVRRPAGRPGRPARRVRRSARGAASRRCAAGRFDGGGWADAPADDRPRSCASSAPDGDGRIVRALGVDAATGALLVEIRGDGPASARRCSSARSATSGSRPPRRPAV